MADKTFKCTVITPESAVLDAEAHFAAIPAHDGEIGILRDRAPLLCRLGVGILRLETDDGPKRLFVDAGFAEVADNNVSILTEQALWAKDIDQAAAQTALEEARRLEPTSTEDHAARTRDIARASTKLKLAAAASEAASA